MKPAIIVAVDKNNLIGKDNKLPWHLPADLAYFKKMTLGKILIMGRKTFSSFDEPLPHRHHIVISHHKSNAQEYSGMITMANSIDTALRLCEQKYPKKEIMIIGGANVFRQFIHYCDKIYMTRICHEFEGDTYFPKIDKRKWHLVKKDCYQADKDNYYNYCFCVLENRALH